MKTIKFYFLLFILIIITSCEKTQICDYKSQETNLRNNWNTELARIEFGRIFAKALTNLSFRIYLKDLLTNLDMNDDELIYSLRRNDYIFNNTKLKDFLSSFSDLQLQQSFGADFFEEIALRDPLMAINYPDVETFDLISWDPNNTIPVVGIKTENLVEISSGIFSAYCFNHSGSLQFLDGASQPTQATLIIVTSEEYVSLDRFSLTLDDGTDFNNFIKVYTGDLPCDELLNYIQDLIAELENTGDQRLVIRIRDLVNQYKVLCTDNPSTTGEIDPDGTCQRDPVIADEMFFDLKLVNNDVKDSYDCWIWENRSDFLVTTSWEKVNGTYTPARNILLAPIRWKYLKDGKTYTTNIRIWEDWNKNEMLRLYYTWSELGSGNGPKNPTVSLSAGGDLKIKIIGKEINLKLGFGFTLPFSSSDCDNIILLGGDIVHYCDQADKPGYLYNTGSILFHHAHNYAR